MIDFILNSSNILTPLFTTLVSIVITLLFHKYSTIANTKKLAVTYTSLFLIEETNNNYENLKIELNGEIIKSLKSSTIKFKNIGNKLITSSDFAPSSPLIIKSTQKILLNDVTKCNISTTNNENIASLIKIDDYCLQINFDFLKPKEEISLTLIHMGDISITGCIINGLINTNSDINTNCI